MKVFGWFLIVSWFVYVIFPGAALFDLFLLIHRDPNYGIPYTLTLFACLGVGIWLVRRKKREKPV